MELKDKNILLISPEPWDHIFVSKHQYAVHLAERNNSVYFLNPPATSELVSATQYDNVFSVTYAGFARGLRFYPPFLRRYFIRKKFNDLQKIAGVQFDIIWSFDNSVFFDFSALPSGVLKINHIVDLNQDFQTTTAAKTAHICFASTQNIVKRLSKFQQFVYQINHGVAMSSDNFRSYKAEGGHRIKALYAGNLGIPYIDWGLLFDLVNTFPQVDFVFLGPSREGTNEIEQIHRLPNVDFRGVVPSAELQKYYSEADVLLITYKADEFREQLSNPHKLMEYLASGKVVVATFTEEYVKQAAEDMLVMSSVESEFVLLFRKVIQNLAYWNNDLLQKKRKDFAMENTYQSQIDRIERLINQRLEV